MIYAAGILLLSKQGRTLFLKRGDGGDCPGTWCFPGGRVEDGETAAQAAIRETAEESGYKKAVADNLLPWTRSTAYRETTGAVPKDADPALVPPPVPAGEGAAVVPGEQVDFTTFVLRDVEEFTPTLDTSEVTAYAWAPVATPPEPLHPGCRIALTRFTMNELDIANAMIAGELTSPQAYGGFTLFNIRITGTGVAFRSRKLGEKATKKDKGKRVDANGYVIEREEEYPVRDPAHYLTDEFLQRCNGLPVVMEHPETQKVDAGEFERRIVGTVFKPFIRGDEVWAVAKIYDLDAIELMTEHQLSTSPGVTWRERAGVVVNIEGKNFLFEGKPSLMDHIAVCRQGVWDKGGPPAGVETAVARKDAIDMDKEELEKLLKANKAETDTAINRVMGAVEGLGAALGKVVSRMDADDEKEEKERKDKARKDAEEHKFSARKDAESDEEYEKRHDAEEEMLCDAFKRSGDSEEDAERKADKARKDAEEEERKDADEKARKDAEEKAKKEEEERKDAANADVKDLRERLAKAEKIIAERVPEVQPKDADSAAFGSVQTRFDDVYSALGRRTPVPMQGESLLAYKRRGLLGVKDVSKVYKDVELGVVVNDSAAFEVIMNGMLKEVGEIARTDASVGAGELREIKKALPGGGEEITFIGDASSLIANFSTGRRFAKIHQRNANGVRSS